MQVYNTNSGWFQLFKFNSADGTFENVKNNKVLDVAGGKDAEATNVQVWKKNGSKAQSWKLTYTSDLKI
jgi:5-hydroxyisourate hydrolase-like protein (transthyretin family)